MDHRCNEGFPDGTAVKNPPASAGDTRDTGLILGQEDPLEKEMATHSSIFGMKNSMDREAWWAIAHVVAKNRIHLSN